MLMPLIDYKKFTKKVASSRGIMPKCPAYYSILKDAQGNKVIQISNGSVSNPTNITQTIQLDEDTIRFLYAQTLIK